MTREPHAALTHIEVCISNIRLFRLSSIRYVRVRGKDWGDAYLSLSV